MPGSSSWVPYAPQRVKGLDDDVTTLYLLKVHLQTFLSIPITQKCQMLSCDTLVANERYVKTYFTGVQLLVNYVNVNIPLMHGYGTY
jgi:hypothetical protein